MMQYLNSTYPTLVLDKASSVLNGSELDLDLRYNSDVYLANEISEAYFTVDELFSFGLHLNDASIIIKALGNWGADLGLNWVEPQPSRYAINNRGNFNLLQLRGVTVVSTCYSCCYLFSLYSLSLCFCFYPQIDVDGVKPSQIDDYLTYPKKTNGVSQFVKYHYNLLTLLQARYNFTYVFHSRK